MLYSQGVINVLYIMDNIGCLMVKAWYIYDI